MVKKMIRVRAPLRVGFAGGGTDVSPFSDIYGGQVLNATISMFAYATIQPRRDEKIIFNSIDRNEKIVVDAEKVIETDGTLHLLKGVYNRVVKDFTDYPLSFELSTYVDAPPGSGLGTSSTLVVAILAAFVEWLNIPLGEYEIAQLAYQIERQDLGLSGGKQDQYAATFGGFNFIEFYKDNKVIVNPLRIKQDYLNELAFNILLYYTGKSRSSSKIIESQAKSVDRKNSSLEAMLKLKEQSVMMKEALLKGQIDEIGKILDFGWKYKKRTANEISNRIIDEIYETAKKAGATGGKISGAGGGGFMIFYCPQNTRYKVIDSLKNYGGEFRRFQFTKNGIASWYTS